jgi:hypothetical protein
LTERICGSTTSSGEGAEYTNGVPECTSGRTEYRSGVTKSRTHRADWAFGARDARRLGSVCATVSVSVTFTLPEHWGFSPGVIPPMTVSFLLLTVIPVSLVSVCR